MDKLKELFSRKKLSRQFAKSGPGYRLNEESSGKSISKEQTHGSSASNSSSKSNSVDARKDPPRLSAAEAAQKRAQEAQQQNQKTTVKMISYKNYPKLENDKNAEPSSSILPEKSSTNEVIKAFCFERCFNLLFSINHMKMRSKITYFLKISSTFLLLDTT